MSTTAAVNEFVARLDGIATEHPYSRKKFRKAAEKSAVLEHACWNTHGCLTLQPAAGAHEK